MSTQISRSLCNQKAGAVWTFGNDHVLLDLHEILIWMIFKIKIYHLRKLGYFTLDLLVRCKAFKTQSKSKVKQPYLASITRNSNSTDKPEVDGQSIYCTSQTRSLIIRVWRGSFLKKLWCCIGGEVPYSVFTPVSRPFMTSKEAPKIALDLYTGQRIRAKLQLNNLFKINIIMLSWA